MDERVSERTLSGICTLQGWIQKFQQQEIAARVHTVLLESWSLQNLLKFKYLEKRGVRLPRHPFLSKSAPVLDCLQDAWKFEKRYEVYSNSVSFGSKVFSRKKVKRIGNNPFLHSARIGFICLELKNCFTVNSADFQMFNVMDFSRCILKKTGQIVKTKSSV